MNISATILGSQAVGDKLLDLDALIQGVIKRNLVEAATLVHKDAIDSITAQESSITEASGSPRRSIRQVSRKLYHHPSAPGYPPNSDTGKLIQNIQFEVDESSLTALVGTNLDYGLFLELGTQKMDARPWLFPAFERNKAKIREILYSPLVEALKGAGNGDR